MSWIISKALQNQYLLSHSQQKHEAHPVALVNTNATWSFSTPLPSHAEATSYLCHCHTLTRIGCRDHSGYGLSQWEEVILCNTFSHLPCVYLIDVLSKVNKQDWDGINGFLTHPNIEYLFIIWNFMSIKDVIFANRRSILKVVIRISIYWWVSARKTKLCC